MFVAVDLRLRAKAGEFVGVAQVFDRLLSRRFFHAENVTRFRPAENCNRGKFPGGGGVTVEKT